MCCLERPSDVADPANPTTRHQSSVLSSQSAGPLGRPADCMICLPAASKLSCFPLHLFSERCRTQTWRWSACSSASCLCSWWFFYCATGTAASSISSQCWRSFPPIAGSGKKTWWWALKHSIHYIPSQIIGHVEDCKIKLSIAHVGVKIRENDPNSSRMLQWLWNTLGESSELFPRWLLSPTGPWTHQQVRIFFLQL